MRWAGRTIGVVLMLAVAGGGVWWLWGARAEAPAALRTHTVALGTLEDSVAAVGTLQPRDYVDVGTQVSGQLREVAVKVGDKVEKGQLLARLDPTVYQARVAADEAALRVLEAQLSERRVQQALAERQFRRQQGLLAEKATSEEAHDSADAQRKVLAAQIAALEAQSQQARSQLEADRANLGYTRIEAPMAGTVVDILARLGQTLNANQQAPIILRIADLDTMTVWAQVAEADVAKLVPGMAAWFTTLGRPDRRRAGTLRQILPTPTVVNNVVLYNALFDVANPEHDLLPQMSAQVFFVVAHVENAPLVPMAALRLAGRGGRPTGKASVQVMVDGKPVERMVEIAATNRVTAALKSGLGAGDVVVLDNAPAGAARVPSFARTPRL
ncbi:MAG: efflux RND transporter periplasmic adaptor subunit [Alphaproteobacteria bacterium]